MVQLQEETNSERPIFNFLRLESWLKKLKIKAGPEDLGIVLTDLIKENKLVIVSVQNKNVMLSNCHPSIPLKYGQNPTPWSR